VVIGFWFFHPHLADSGDLVFRGNDEGDHGGAVSSGILEAFDEFLDFPDLDVRVRAFVRHRGTNGMCGCWSAISRFFFRKWEWKKVQMGFWVKQFLRFCSSGGKSFAIICNITGFEK
jgi:hypothetical protein